jgi:hypothetical protein
MIVEGHNGEISVSSGDRGATFEITLPTEKANQVRVEEFEANKLQNDDVVIA